MERDSFPKELESRDEKQVINEMAGNLRSLKKSYDTLRQKSNKLDTEILFMRGEISYIKVYQEEKMGDSSKIQGKQELTKEQCQEMIV